VGDYAHRHRDSRLLYIPEQVSAFVGAQQLAIPYLFYPLPPRLSGQDDGGGNHGAGKSAASGFIDAGDVAIALCR